MATKWQKILYKKIHKPFYSIDGQTIRMNKFLVRFSVVIISFDNSTDVCFT